MKFRIRIDDVNNVKADVTEWASRQCGGSKFLIVHHLVNDNSHYHLYMDAPMTISAPAMRYKVKTTFKLDNVQYSVKQCDDDRVREYCQYLFNTKHDNVATIHYTNVDPDNIALYQREAEAVSTAFAKSRANKKPLSLYDMAKEVHATVGVFQDEREIMAVVLRVLHKYCKCHDRYLARKVFDTALYMFDPDRILSQYML